MGRKFTGREQEWIFDHGFQVDERDMILIPKSKWWQLAGTGKRLSNPVLRTLTVPSDKGLCLLTEGMHFEIVGG